MNITASIVSVGSWNPRIFTPKWVSENVFSMPEGDTMNIAINDKQMNLTYSWKRICLLMTDRGIELKSDAKSLDVWIQMETIYRHLSDVLPYTPVSAVGYNLNLAFSKEEFGKTKIAKIIKPYNVDIYSINSQTFSASKDGAIRSFDIRTLETTAEIRCNFHYASPQKARTDNSVFEIIIEELKKFIGYEFTV